MAWVTDNLVSQTGAAVAADVISKEFHCEDPRYLSVTVVGGLGSAVEIQTRSGDGAWTTLTDVAVLGTDTVQFVSATQLLQDQCRVRATGPGNVDKVFISRKM